jgi:multidrug efflux pump
LLVQISTPEGSGFETTARVVDQVEAVLMGYVESGEAIRVLVVAPGFGDQGTNRFSSGFGRVFLEDWDNRERHGNVIVGEMNKKLGEIPGAVIRAVMQDPFQQRGGGGGLGAGVAVVLGGQDYAELEPLADRIVARLRNEPGLIRPRHNYDPSTPRVVISIDRERAAQLGVPVRDIGRALESTMGARRVNTLPDRGREYYVFLQAEREARSEIAAIEAMPVRSTRTGEVIPLSSVIRYEEIGDSAERRRFDRMAAITVVASLPPGTAIGDALNRIETIAKEEIGQQNIKLGYAGQAREFKQASSAILFAFALALLIVFLVLAAQFESFVHPFVIMLSVPLAVAGGLFGMFMFGQTLNLYAQIGLIILIALAAKNGILIVEFANQLRDEGRTVREAILEAADLRVRPVLMTSVATVIGALPLMLATGAGAESRQTIGVVTVFGLSISTLLTLFVVPVFYDLLARFTRSPEAVAKDIERFEDRERAGISPHPAE